MDAELRHLRALVALAEELSFTRAAKRLHIGQQGLSKQISQLEERVGTPLVVRSSRHVELTPAGRVMAERAGSLLAEADATVAAARAAAAGQGGTLTVGFQAFLDHEHVRPALDAFTAAHPDVDVQVAFGILEDPTGGLRDGNADVAVVHGPFDHTGIECVRLWDEQRGLAMAPDYHLAQRESLTLADYVAEPTFDIPSSDRMFRDFWTGTRHRHGVPPRFVAQFRSLDSAIEALRAGLGVYPTIQRLLDAGGGTSGVILRDLPGLDPMEYQVAWRAGDDRPLVAEFAAAMQREFAPADAEAA